MSRVTPVRATASWHSHGIAGLCHNLGDLPAPVIAGTYRDCVTIPPNPAPDVIAAHETRCVPLVVVVGPCNPGPSGASRLVGAFSDRMQDEPRVSSVIVSGLKSSGSMLHFPVDVYVSADTPHKAARIAVAAFSAARREVEVPPSLTGVYAVAAVGQVTEVDPRPRTPFMAPVAAEMPRSAQTHRRGPAGVRTALTA